MTLGLSVLFAFSVANAAPPCERACLAPLVVVGGAPQERVALEAALSRALNATRCTDALVVEQACFEDDRCLQGRAASRGQRFIANRAVLVAGRVRLRVVAVAADGVRRVDVEEDLLAFLAAGGLNEELAACPAAPEVAVPIVPPTPVAAPPPPSTEPVITTAPVPPPLALPLLAAGGVGVGVAAIAVIAAALALEQPTLDGGAKSGAVVVGWAGLGIGVVGVVVAALGASLLLPGEP